MWMKGNSPKGGALYWMQRTLFLIKSNIISALDAMRDNITDIINWMDRCNNINSNNWDIIIHAKKEEEEINVYL